MQKDVKMATSFSISADLIDGIRQTTPDYRVLGDTLGPVATFRIVGQDWAAAYTGEVEGEEAIFDKAHIWSGQKHVSEREIERIFFELAQAFKQAIKLQKRKRWHPS